MDTEELLFNCRTMQRFFIILRLAISMKNIIPTLEATETEPTHFIKPPLTAAAKSECNT